MLLRKEAREILASRAYWLMLALLGPLVAQAFTTAVNTYAEASRGGLPQALSPLDGILVPVFGIYDIAAMLFFPFVVIRLVSTERENGGWTLLLQGPFSAGRMLAAKAVALLGAWIVAWIPGVIAMGLWRAYGGHIDARELGCVLLGYALRGALTIGVAMAAAAVARSAASAAIVTLAFTVGTWALDFVALGRGGWLQALAAYTPANALRLFENGLISPAKSLAPLGASIAGVALATVAMSRGARALRLLALGATVVILAAALGRLGNLAYDVSEDRRNSFPAADAHALAAVNQPLNITVKLAPEDPRLNDLERNVLGKLARTMNVTVKNDSQSSTGLFDGPGYGEIWYEIGGRRVMSRSTTEPIVLATIYKLAGVAVPAPDGDNPYPGYPLSATPRYAVALLAILWPLMMAVLCWSHLYANP